MAMGKLGQLGKGFGKLGALQGAGDPTVLRRESDGTVTVVSLATPWKPTLTRQGDGTVTVTG